MVDGTDPFCPCPGTFMAQGGTKYGYFWGKNRAAMAMAMMMLMITMKKIVSMMKFVISMVMMATTMKE